MAIAIVVFPSRKRRESDFHHTGLFDAYVDGGLLVERTRTPFCDGARALLARGLAGPDDLLVMRHAGSGHDALKAAAGAAAGFTVREETKDGKPRSGKWRPHPRALGNTPAGQENV